MTPPEPCRAAVGRCYSPLACNGFGYCRERNLVTGFPPNEATMERWRREAAATVSTHKTYGEARAALPADATWSSTFGNPGDGGYSEWYRQPDGTRWEISNGLWNAVQPFSWTLRNRGIAV